MTGATSGEGSQVAMHLNCHLILFSSSFFSEYYYTKIINKFYVTNLKKIFFFSNNKLKLAIQWWSDNNSVERAPVDYMLCVEVCDVFFRHFLQSDDLVQVVVVARLSADHHHDRCKSQKEKYPTLRE